MNLKNYRNFKTNKALIRTSLGCYTVQKDASEKSTYLDKLALDREFRAEISKYWKIEKKQLNRIVASPELMSKNDTVSTGKMFGVLLMFEHWKGKVAN